MSLNNGIFNLNLFTWFLATTISSAALQLVNENGSQSWKIIFLLLAGVLALMFFLSSVNSLTNPNKTWIKQCNQLLNDPRLQYRIEQVFGQRFDEWLLKHELSSQRAFGIKITINILNRLSASVGSALVIVLYLIMREEIRTMMTAV